MSYALSYFNYDANTDEYVDRHGNRKGKMLVDHEMFAEKIRKAEVQAYMEKHRIGMFINDNELD